MRPLVMRGEVSVAQVDRRHANVSNPSSCSTPSQGTTNNAGGADIKGNVCATRDEGGRQPCLAIERVATVSAFLTVGSSL